MKIEVIEKGVFDENGAELEVGAVIEVSGQDMPRHLVSKARIADGERVAITNPAQDAIAEPVDDEAEIEALRAEYFGRTGDEADGRWKAKTLRAKIAELD